MRDIKREEIPCWYELSYVPDWKGAPAITVRIHYESMAHLRSLPNDAPIIRRLIADGRPKGLFVAPRTIGFGNCLELESCDGDFHRYTANIPVLHSRGNPCEMCDFMKEEDLPCRYCNDSGFQTVYDWSAAENLAASLYVLFLFLNNPKWETSCLLPQLLTARLNVKLKGDKGMGARGVSGEFSAKLVRWFKTFEMAKFPNIEKVMRDVYARMIGEKDYLAYEFKAVIHHDGAFHLSVPGNACGIDPDGSSRIEQEGYGYLPHNVDSTVQQLSILSGLAALNDLARREMQKEAQRGLI